MERIREEFFHRPCLEVARDLVGKVLVRKTADGELRLRISETEAYCGEADTACHAHKGRTRRTEVMYGRPGTLYIYLCYGIHWLMNIVTGEEETPEAVLIRACLETSGPGKLTRQLGITGQWNSRGLDSLEDLWIEDDGSSVRIETAPRIGIGYASQEDQARPWRFVMAAGSANAAASAAGETKT